MTSYDFPEGANRLSLLFRLWPEPYAGLTVRQWQVSVNDKVITPGPRNGYGERTALWSGPVDAGHISIVAQGTVESDDRAGVVAGLNSRTNPTIFLRSTRRTEADEAILALAGDSPAPAERLAWLHRLMEQVRSTVRYVSGSTSIATSAIDAVAAGAGVCQDHSHVFLAACRAHGIPARYVCGYLSAVDEHYALHETHAWVEAWVENIGWVGFDPSSGLCPTERYVRLCVGLDAVDAAPIRGHASGGEAKSLYADVRITPHDISLPLAWGAEVSPQEQQIRMQQQQQQQQ